MSTVAEYVAKGYRVTSQGPHGTQLVRPRKFSLMALLLSCLVFGVGGVVYLVWYLAKRDAQLFIDEHGVVHGQKWTFGRWFMGQSRAVQAALVLGLVVAVLVVAL